METLVLSAFAILSLLAFIVKKIANSTNQEDNKADANREKAAETQETKFKKLQWKFFSAYFLALLGDWLQGPYVYQVTKQNKRNQNDFL